MFFSGPFFQNYRLSHGYLKHQGNQLGNSSILEFLLEKEVRFFEPSNISGLVVWWCGGVVVWWCDVVVRRVLFLETVASGTSCLFKVVHPEEQPSSLQLANKDAAVRPH